MTKTKNWLLALFVVLWITDTLLTMKFVKLHGVEMEANPVPRYMMQNFGLLGFGVFKVAMITPLLAIRKHVYNWLYAILILIMVPVVYAGVVVAFDLLGR